MSAWLSFADALALADLICKAANVGAENYQLTKCAALPSPLGGNFSSTDGQETSLPSSLALPALVSRPTREKLRMFVVASDSFERGVIVPHDCAGIP
jgi:hypothetical protein